MAMFPTKLCGPTCPGFLLFSAVRVYVRYMGGSLSAQRGAVGGTFLGSRRAMSLPSHRTMQYCVGVKLGKQRMGRAKSARVCVCVCACPTSTDHGIQSELGLDLTALSVKVVAP